MFLPTWSSCLSKALAALGENYAAIYSQMRDLGLVANRNATVGSAKKPIPVVMLAGVPVKKLGV